VTGVYSSCVPYVPYYDDPALTEQSLHSGIRNWNTQYSLGLQLIQGGLTAVPELQGAHYYTSIRKWQISMLEHMYE